jgi:hypothetical protein
LIVGDLEDRQHFWIVAFSDAKPDSTTPENALDLDAETDFGQTLVGDFEKVGSAARDPGQEREDRARSDSFARAP